MILSEENMRIFTAVLISAGCLQMATAATITQYNRATFQTALAAATLSGQNFDSLPLGNITTVNGVTYTPSLGTALVTSTYLTTTGANGLGSTSVGFFQTNETLTITFGSAITAFALDINTFAPNSGDYHAVVNDGSGSVIPSIFDVFPNTSTGQFLGFTDSSPFTSIVISALLDSHTQTTYPYTVDTLVYGDAAAVSGVPEPSTLTMLGMGMAFAGLLARRRKLL